MRILHSGSKAQIPETMVWRILMLMWSVRPLQQHGRLRVQGCGGSVRIRKSLLSTLN